MRDVARFKCHHEFEKIPSHAISSLHVIIAMDNIKNAKL